jgi:two-component system, cell cycle sensor histidine kinase and response regulator CckA
VTQQSCFARVCIKSIPSTQGIPYDIEFRVIRPDASFVWLNAKGFATRNSEGVIVRLFGTAQDISERKQAEDRLQKSESLFRSVFESTTDCVLVWDKDFNYLYANQASIDHFGAARDKVIGKNIRDGLAHVPDFMNLWMRRVEQVFATGRPMRVSDFVSLGNKVVFSESVLFPILAADGSMFAVGVVYRDVTERRKAAEVRTFLATAIEQSAEVVFIKDARGKIQYANLATEKITGFSRSEIIGNTPRIFKSGMHDSAFYEELWSTIQAGKVWTGRIVNKKKDGALYHEEATISPVRDASGKILNFVAVKKDITEHLELTRQLVQAQKMEAIGTLAGGIAHDFNNLLTVVLGYSELLLEDMDAQDAAYADLQKISQAGQKGADLVSRLLAFGRKSDARPRSLNMNSQIEQFQKLLTRTIPKMIEINLRLAEGLSPVNADPTQMDQVLMNLAVNAKDAMPAGGTLVLETMNVFLDEEYARTHLEARPGPYVLVSVSDTGHGMNKETLEHIFEPFYTTKTAGKGTGLGPAMVYGIVKQHGGQVRCYSEPGHGTTFKVYLPALVGENSQGEVMSEETTLTGGTETILLVDDQELVRDLGKRILEGAGYTVLTAGDGTEALDMYKREEEISLVILDLIMPKMGGRQCLEELLKVDPKTRVLIASGFSQNGKTRETVETGAKGLLSKPYRMGEMLQSVRKVLDEI